MYITTEAGALFDDHPRLKNKALLLDITIGNLCAGSSLGNAARHVGKHLADAVERKKNKYRGSFPAIYSLLPFDMSTCSEVGSDVHALIKELAIRRAKHRSETHSNESQHLAEGTEVARLWRRFSFVSQQALLFRTRHHLCRQGVALASTRQLHSQGPVSVQAYRRERVTGSEEQDGANESGGGIGVGGGNGDGNGVGGGNGDVNGHGDGDGAGVGMGTGVKVNEGAQDGNRDGSGDGAGTGAGTGVETRRRTPDGNGDANGHGNGDGAGVGMGTGVKVNEGAQDGNRDGSGDGAGTGAGTGVETRRRTPDGNGDGNGDGSKNSSGDRNEDEDNGNGNKDRIGEGRKEAKKREKPQNSCRPHVGNGGGKRKKCRIERIGSVAANNIDSLESNKEAGGGSTRYSGLK